MPLSNSNPILIRKYGDSMTECHSSVMSQQTSTATNRARVMHAVIHAWYMSGLILRSVYIAITDSGPRGPRYIGALLYILYTCDKRHLMAQISGPQGGPRGHAPPPLLHKMCNSSETVRIPTPKPYIFLFLMIRHIQWPRPWVTWPRWRPCPYMVKTLKKFSSLEPLGRFPRNLVYSIGDSGPS